MNGRWAWSTNTEGMGLPKTLRVEDCGGEVSSMKLVGIANRTELDDAESDKLIPLNGNVDIGVVEVV